jgi:hypothetical protein
MKAEYLDDEEMSELDFSNAVRGAFANRWTPEEREAIRRDGAIGTVRELARYGEKELRRLEAALFTLLVLAADEPLQKAESHAVALLDSTHVHTLDALVDEARDEDLLEERLAGRIRHLAEEREWLAQSPTGPYTGPGSLNPVADRLDLIYDEARCLRVLVDNLIKNHLARSGLSEQEIERKTEETAKLWLAA